jgi:hypothetical protein
MLAGAWRSGDRWRRSGLPGGINLEVAHKLSEQTSWDRHKRRWEGVFEIFEVLVLAVAAIATAWTGYQAARGTAPNRCCAGRRPGTSSEPTPLPH